MKMDGKWVAMLVVPVLAIAAIGYVYVRSANRALEGQMAGLKQQNDAMHGEIYRLRQDAEGKEARLRFINDPGMTRFKAVGASDSTSCWLFWRKADGSWYAEVSHVRPIPAGYQFRLYTADGAPEYVGSFEALAETVGLQKVGKTARAGRQMVTVADRESAPNPAAEEVAYRTSGSQD